MITVEQRQMAAMLNYCPSLESSWPLDLINKLIWIKKEKGERELFSEIDKLNGGRGLTR